MTKENKKKVTLTLIGLFLLSGWFYWFQFRPARIKHECSWVRHYEAAKPATIGKSEEELWQDGTLKDCTNKQKFTSVDAFNFCERRNRFLIEADRPKPAEPEKEWYSEASEKEYKFCLHDKGL